MDREKALDKIQKLLAIGRRSNHQHEAETALAQAHRLMLAHNIEMGEVDEAEIGGDDAWIAETFWRGKRSPVETKFLIRTVEEFFFVRIVYVRLRYANASEMQFFGDRHNVAIARYVWVFLVRTFRELWRIYKRNRRMSEADRQAYYWGLEEGFREKLRRERDSELRYNLGSTNALIVVGDRLDSAFDEEFPGILTSKKVHKIRESRSSVADGRRDGANINLRTPIAGESNQPRRLGHAR